MTSAKTKPRCIPKHLRGHASGSAPMGRRKLAFLAFDERRALRPQPSLPTLNGWLERARLLQDGHPSNPPLGTSRDYTV